MNAQRIKTAAARLGSAAPWRGAASIGLAAALACTPAYDAAQQEDSGDMAVAASDHAVAASIFDAMAADVAEVEEKLVGLAEAMSEEHYAWRPMEGTRSAGELFMHVTADNYLLPALAGVPAPEHTNVTTDYQSALDFEASVTGRQAVIDEMKASFAHLRAALAAVDPATALDELQFFGRTDTVQGLWLLTTVHLHEHLGNGITYARANQVVPPWSRADDG